MFKSIFSLGSALVANNRELLCFGEVWTTLAPVFFVRLRCGSQQRNVVGFMDEAPGRRRTRGSHLSLIDTHDHKSHFYSHPVWSANTSESNNCKLAGSSCCHRSRLVQLTRYNTSPLGVIFILVVYSFRSFWKSSRSF